MTNMNRKMRCCKRVKLAAGQYTAGILTILLTALIGLGGVNMAAAEESKEKPAAKPAAEKADKPASKPEAGSKESALEAALKKLKLPGVKINLKEKCVDVESTICLASGALEFIACKKNTKEHESLVIVEAKAKHIHAALLLIGAKPGNPAMHKPVGKNKDRWIHVPPSGQGIHVSFVIKDDAGKTVEHPISYFIEPLEKMDGVPGYEDEEDEEKEGFPTDTFLFAGSILHENKDGSSKYLADVSGHFVSVATFGDELLCLPGMYAHAAGALMWQINNDRIPPVDTKIIMRLRPDVGGNSEPHDPSVHGPVK